MLGDTYYFGIYEYAIIFTILLILILPPLIGYTLAKAKNRPILLWSFLCFIFPPAVIVILCLSKEDNRPKKICPYCAELILNEAQICKHCGRDV